jgi:hypothetical protein
MIPNAKLFAFENGKPLAGLGGTKAVTEIALSAAGGMFGYDP